MSTLSEQPRARFLSRLDQPPVPRVYALLTLLVAAEFARRFLAYRTLTFVHIAVSGRPAASLASAGWRWPVRGAIVEVLLATAVGILAGLGVRRAKWAAGAAIIPLLAGLSALWVLSLHGRGVAVATTPPATVRFSLALEAWQMVALLVVTVCAGLGGAASAWVFRRVRPSAAVSAALAWIGVSILVGLSQQALIAGVQDRLFGEWSATWLLIGVVEGFPYLIGGLWMRWALRARYPWAAALMVSGVAVAEVLRGYLVFSGGEWWSLAPRYVSWYVTRLAWAAGGAYLAGWWFGLTQKSERSREALAMVTLVALAAAVALIAAGVGTDITSR